MLDFAPTEEQEEIRHLAHNLAVEQLRPQARTSEKRGDISDELMQTLVQTGLTTPFSEDYGGSGAIEAITYALIAEELGFGDAALATNIIGSMMGPLTVALAGSDRQREQYLYPFVDPREGYKARGSLAFAERTGGFTVAEISATARREGENYIINGTKRDIIHGKRSNPRVVLLRIENTVKTDALCAFVLPEGIDGIRVGGDVQKLGLIAAPGASYVFDNAIVPSTALLGEPGNDGASRAAALYNILRAGIACGTTRASLQYCSAYAEERIAFGRPIVAYQGIAFMIAEMAMKLDATRLLLWNAAANWDRAVDLDVLMRDAAAAQQQAIQLARSATIDAVQVMGGAGFMQDHPVEMWMRDAAAME
jgi:alkylation response protein AidB-like acyl-CoA dehydrogenase